jgi:hypothetical protein
MRPSSAVESGSGQLRELEQRREHDGWEQITLTPPDDGKFGDEGCKALPGAAEDENDHGRSR